MKIMDKLIGKMSAKAAAAISNIVISLNLNLLVSAIIS